MILTDYSGVAISAIINSAMREKMQLDEQVIKHIVFSSFRNIHKKLGPEFGEHLLLCDSRSWRKDAFVHYKANRVHDDSAESLVDWTLIFKMMDEIRDAFDKHFPFHVISAKNCEADDLIAAFAKKATEPTCIVSKDKDFFQLHRLGIKQYHHSKKEFIEVPDPVAARVEHIIRGDSGDGIPNVLSDDDTFVTSKRQKAMREKVFNECLEYAKSDFKDAPANLKRNWDRNKLMIDLMNPVENALEAYDKYRASESKEITQNDTANYFASQKMVVLFGRVSDFYQGRTKKEESSGPLSSFM